MYLPKTVKVYDCQNCVCGNNDCNEITKKFQELEDYRGQFCTVPNPNQDSRQNTRGVNLQKWLSRFCFHFKLSEESFRTSTNSNSTEEEAQNVIHEEETQEESKEDNSKSARKKDAYFAAWHFDYQLLNHMLHKWKRDPKAAKRFTIPRFVDVSTLKKLNLYQSRGGNSYSEADIVDKEKASDKQQFCLVPTYVNIKAVSVDIKNAVESKKAFDLYNNAQTWDRKGNIQIEIQNCSLRSALCLG